MTGMRRFLKWVMAQGCKRNAWTRARDAGHGESSAPREKNYSLSLKPRAGKDYCRVAPDALSTHAIAGAAGGLGVVERRVGASQQGLFFFQPVAVDQPDAGGGDAVAAVDAQRPATVLDDLLRHAQGVVAFLDVLEQHDEFVAAEARHGVARAHARAQSGGEVPEQSVTRGVAERVVHVLEAVEVEIEERDLRAIPPRARRGHAQPVAEMAAVGDAGQGGGRRRRLDRLLHAPAVGDVEVGADHAQRTSAGRVALGDTPAREDPFPFPIACTHAVLDGVARARALHRFESDPLQVLDIRRMRNGEELLGGYAHFAGRLTEDAGPGFR